MILPIRSNKRIWSRSGSSKPKKLLHGWNMLECRWVSPTNWGQDYYQQVGRTAVWDPDWFCLARRSAPNAPITCGGNRKRRKPLRLRTNTLIWIVNLASRWTFCWANHPSKTDVIFFQLLVVDRGSHRYTHYFREKAGGTCGQLWRSMFTSWFTNPSSYTYSML